MSTDTPTSLEKQQPPDPAQLPLDPAVVAPPARPWRGADYVMLAAAEKLLPQVLDWLKSNGDDHAEDEKETILKHIVSAIDTTYDGFSAVKDFEREGYEGDEELVEIFGMAGCHKSDAYSRACEEWVKAYQVRPLPLGLKVKWPGAPHGKNYGVGEVYEIHANGTASIRFPDMGHGVKVNGCGTMGSIIAWEEVVAEPGQDELIAAGPLTYIPPPPKPDKTDHLAGMKPKPPVKPSLKLSAEELLQELRLIAHATAPTPGVPDDESGYHEAAYELSTDAISRATGEPRPW